MTKHIVLQFYAGGGSNGLSQIMMAEAGEVLSGIKLLDIVDITAAGSVGNFAALTSLQKTSDNQSVFSQLRPRFKAAAKETICGIQRQTQLRNGLIHDIYHATQSDPNPLIDDTPKGFGTRISSAVKDSLSSTVLSDRTDAIHLDPTPLANLVTEHFGDITLNNLQSPYFSYCMNKTTAEFGCFGNLSSLPSDLFFSHQWSDAILKNEGANYTLRDIVLSSIAAPTLFKAHSAKQNQFVDCASFHSPLGLVRNLLRMNKDNKTPIHIHVLYIGTGRQDTETTPSPTPYNNLGTIRALAEYNSDVAMALLKREMRELRDVYSDHVTVHHLDVEFPHEYNGNPFIRDPFNGSIKYLNAIEEMTQNHININEQKISDIFSKIADSKTAKVADPTQARMPWIRDIIDSATSGLGSLLPTTRPGATQLSARLLNPLARLR